MAEMTEQELMQKNIEEFARLQTYMILAEKDSSVYKAMKGRYIELKVILTIQNRWRQRNGKWDYCPSRWVCGRRR